MKTKRKYRKWLSGLLAIVLLIGGLQAVSPSADNEKVTVGFLSTYFKRFLKVKKVNGGIHIIKNKEDSNAYEEAKKKFDAELAQLEKDGYIHQSEYITKTEKKGETWIDYTPTPSDYNYQDTATGEWEIQLGRRDLEDGYISKVGAVCPTKKGSYHVDTWLKKLRNKTTGEIKYAYCMDGFNQHVSNKTPYKIMNLEYLQSGKGRLSDAYNLTELRKVLEVGFRKENNGSDNYTEFKSKYGSHYNDRRGGVYDKKVAVRATQLALWRKEYSPMTYNPSKGKIEPIYDIMFDNTKEFDWLLSIRDKILKNAESVNLNEGAENPAITLENDGKLEKTTDGNWKLNFKYSVSGGNSTLTSPSFDIKVDGKPFVQSSDNSNIANNKGKITFTSNSETPEVEITLRVAQTVERRSAFVANGGYGAAQTLISLDKMPTKVGYKKTIVVKRENTDKPREPKKYASLSIFKVDSEELKKAENETLSKGLEGAKFELSSLRYGSNFTKQTEATNNKGYAEFTNIPEGVYVLTEVQTPKGYKVPDWQGNPNTWARVVVDHKGNVTFDLGGAILTSESGKNENNLVVPYPNDKKPKKAPTLKTKVSIDINGKTGFTTGSPLTIDSRVVENSVILRDTITYTGLTESAEYKVNGRLMKIKVNNSNEGVPVATADGTFNSNGDGDWNLDFKGIEVAHAIKNLDPATERLVVYETVEPVDNTADIIKVKPHEDPNDVDQTLRSSARPTFRTKIRLGGKESKPGTVLEVTKEELDGKKTIRDVISYEGLSPNTKYYIYAALCKADVNNYQKASIVQQGYFHLQTGDSGDGTFDTVTFGIEDTTLKALKSNERLVVVEHIDSFMSVGGDENKDKFTTFKYNDKEYRHFYLDHMNYADLDQTIRIVEKPTPVPTGGSLSTKVGIKYNNSAGEFTKAAGGVALTVNKNSVQNAVIQDTITYTNLASGSSYTVTGSLMKVTDDKTVTDLGITTSSAFKAGDGGKGEWNVEFTGTEVTNAIKGLKGNEKLVVYEVAEGEGTRITHEAPNDENQTIKSEGYTPTPPPIPPNPDPKPNPPTPPGPNPPKPTPPPTPTPPDIIEKAGKLETKIGVKLADYLEKFTESANGTALAVIQAAVQDTAVIQDTINYSDLKEGASYTVTGKLMKVTNGTATETNITKSETFTAGKDGKGEWKLEFSGNDVVNAIKGLKANEKLVVYEVAKLGEKEIKHEDANDNNQTIVALEQGIPPSIKTKVDIGPFEGTINITHTAEQGQKLKISKNDITNKTAVYDTITYSNLRPNTYYTLYAALVKVINNNDGTSSNEIITHNYKVGKWTKEGRNGEWQIGFRGSAVVEALRNLKENEKLVVVEQVLDPEIIQHMDYDDDDQTIITDGWKPTPPDPTPPDPTPPDPTPPDLTPPDPTPPNPTPPKPPKPRKPAKPPKPFIPPTPDIPKVPVKPNSSPPPSITAFKPPSVPPAPRHDVPVIRIPGDLDPEGTHRLNAPDPDPELDIGDGHSPRGGLALTGGLRVNFVLMAGILILLFVGLGITETIRIKEND